jgi:hypothetical protein
MYFITAGEVEIELPNQRVRLSDGTFLEKSRCCTVPSAAAW